jgi:hypothetical protein
MPNPAFKPAIKLRFDFPLEAGFVDAMRKPMPRERFALEITKYSAELQRHYSYEIYVATCAKYRHPRWMGYLVLQQAADDQCSMAITDGHRMRLADFEGLFRDLLGRFAHALGTDGIMDLPIFPNPPQAPETVAFPDQFILHDTHTGEAGLYPWSQRSNYMAVGRSKIAVPKPPGK